MPDPRPPPDAERTDDRPIPHAPKDTSVYGGNWGGETETPGTPPPDRPDRLKTPSEPEGEAGP
jgi:hypothetical protein